MRRLSKDRGVLFGNVGTMAVFRVGSEDAELLEKEFAPYFSLEDLRIQENGSMICKRMVGGKQSQPYSTETYPRVDPDTTFANKETVIRVSRERNARARDKVERKIEQLLGKRGGDNSPRPRLTL